jgi:hypothetical protein
MKLLFIADMHVGSRKGLTPEKAIDNYSNSFQKWLLDKWNNEFIPNYKHPDYLCLLGDIVDGSGPRDSVELVTTNVDRQVEWAVELLSPLIGENTKVLGLSGSGYHTGKGTGFNGDYGVVKSLKGLWKPERFWILLSEYEEYILAFHRSKNPVTELKTLQENFYKNPGLPKPTRVVSAHLHRYSSVDDGITTLYQISCWEYLTNFMEGQGKIPSIGALQLEFLDKETKIVSNINYKIPSEVFSDMDNWIGNLPELNEKLIEDKKQQNLNLLQEALNYSLLNDLTNKISALEKIKESIEENLPLNGYENNWSRYK